MYLLKNDISYHLKKVYTSRYFLIGIIIIIIIIIVIILSFNNGQKQLNYAENHAFCQAMTTYSH